MFLNSSFSHSTTELGIGFDSLESFLHGTKFSFKLLRSLVNILSRYIAIAVGEREGTRERS